MTKDITPTKDDISQKNRPSAGKQAPKTKRVYIPRLSENYFFNSALYYLQRYASTEANLHRILNGKVLRAKQKGAVIPPEYPQWIDQAVEKCVKLGYINDRHYAESKITSMRREGRSMRFIQQSLYQKGIKRELLGDLLQEMQSQKTSDETGAESEDETGADPELLAALRTIKRRSLMRADRLAQMDQDTRRDHYQKNLARLIRAGFSLQIAKEALDQSLPDL